MHRWTFNIPGSPGAEFRLAIPAVDLPTAQLEVRWLERIAHVGCDCDPDEEDRDAHHAMRACFLSVSPADRVALATALLEGTDHKAVQR